MNNCDTIDLLSHKTAASFEDLVKDHQFRVRNYISSLGVARSSIDDIAQNAFLVAYKQFDSFEHGSSFPAWVCTIARNLVWNDRRKTSRRFNILNEMATECIIEQDASSILTEKEDSDLQHSALRECMQKIPEDSRHLIEMRYQKYLEPTAIAGQLDIQANTVRQRLWRVREALRNCISEYVDRKKERREPKTE